MQIHWHEGLFLLPHHLQRFQKNVSDALATDRSFAIPFPYGAVDARVSRDDLEQMRVRFDRLHVVMPSGTIVDFPNAAELPVVDIKAALNANSTVQISLGVPLWFPARANCANPDGSTDPRAKILYRVVETEWADENTGSSPRPLLHRRVNARLLIDDEDRSDLEVIPLLRVVRSAGEDIGIPRQDPEFVGPCLILGGSTSLRDLVRDLSAQILAARQELVIQLNRGGFSIDTLRGVQFEQMMRLSALNRAAGRIESIVNAPSIVPFTSYLELRTLLGDLSALNPDRDLFDCPPYDHDNPYPCFKHIVEKIRTFLRGSVVRHFIKVVFEQHDGVLQAALTEEHFTAPTDYFLGIRTKQDPLALARFVENEDRFKFMPKSLGLRAIRGVLLKEERFPPLELPAQSGLYYFRLLRAESQDMWNMIRQEKSAVVRWSGNDDADYHVTLFMTLPHSP